MSRAITLVESRRADHREAAQDLLVELLPHAGGARRVGISGVPGVGKSTFIDQLGVTLTPAGGRGGGGRGGTPLGTPSPVSTLGAVCPLKKKRLTITPALLAPPTPIAVGRAARRAPPHL